MMRGMDFSGNTSCADAKPPSAGGVTETFSGMSDVFSTIVDFYMDFSVKTDDRDVSKFTCPKDPSKISNREEVSVPIRAIVILPSLHIIVGQLSPPDG